MKFARMKKEVVTMKGKIPFGSIVGIVGQNIRGFDIIYNGERYVEINRSSINIIEEIDAATAAKISEMMKSIKTKKIINEIKSTLIDSIIKSAIVGGTSTSCVIKSDECEDFDEFVLYSVESSMIDLGYDVTVTTNNNATVTFTVKWGWE